MAEQRTPAAHWLTPTRSERLRLWVTHRLLAAAWRALPKWHPAMRGIFDAACALRDPVLADNLATRTSAVVGIDVETFCTNTPTGERAKD